MIITLAKNSVQTREKCGAICQFAKVIRSVKIPRTHRGLIMHWFRFTALAAVALFGFVSVASAADLPVKARAYSPSPVAVPTWTGFYIGAHIGGGFATSDWADTVPGSVGLNDANPKPSGFLGGGQIGYNYQINNIVLGIEGEGTWANLNNSVSGCFQDVTQSCSTKATDFATVTGRLGLTWDRALFYAKGGAAWGHFKYENPDPVFGASPDYFANETRSGWTVGGGIEYALNNNWSVKLEYDYLDFGASTRTFTGSAGDTFTETITNRVQMVKFGANYLFR